MRKILQILIFLLVVGAIAYQFRGTLSAKVLPVLSNIRNNLSVVFEKIAPCNKPIPYTLGTFDAQFDISKTYFLSALAEAETIWEKPAGIDLFNYAPQDSSYTALKVNLIYDERQQATSKLASLGIVVKDNRASYDMLKAKFTALKEEYNKQKKAFSASVAAFNSKQLAYENEVSSWNRKGGAPTDDYNRLQAERKELDAESKELDITQAHINSMADEINALVVVLNRLVGVLNISVDNYNTTNLARGESFEEGLYSTDGAKREIDIYEFSSRSKLVRVLAHELGHALGLDHVDDPKAIMYKLNQSSSVVLSADDLAALKMKCGIK